MRKKAAIRRKAWAVWSNGDSRSRVQINEPILARTFSRLKGVVRIGYSVLGPYTQLYVTDHSITWVQAWLKEQTSKLGLAKMAEAQNSPSTEILAA